MAEIERFTKLIRNIIVVLVLLSVTATPAFGWPLNFFTNSNEVKDLDERLDDIDSQVQIISEDGKIMRFGNLNMWDQDISIIVVQIMNNKEVKKSYYIQRNDEGESATISSDYSHYISEDVWLFKPTVEEAEAALVIYNSRKVTYDNIINSIRLIKSIENENVPKVKTLIDNMSETTWNKITKYLPNPSNRILNLFT